MTEPTQFHFDRDLARFARGELSAAEARELAQASLESSLWFEDLTATALARTAVMSAHMPVELKRRAWWCCPLLLATASAVVIVAFASLYLERMSR
jgi:hypothetical protein